MSGNVVAGLVKDNDKRHMVAATAIAVHLFQDDEVREVGSSCYPEEGPDYENMVNEIDFALSLDNICALNIGGIRKVVSKYGILEPSREHPSSRHRF
jgi:hypothetical protein